MSKTAKSSLKSAQLQMRMLNFQILGLGGGQPAIAGFDANLISSVVRNGAGDYTIIFRYPFVRAVELMGWASYTAAVTSCRVTAVAFDRITVLLDADGNVSLTVLGSDFRFNMV